MIQNKTTLELTINEHNYLMICNSDSPLGEVYDALTQMRSHIVDMIKKNEPVSEEADGDEIE